MLGFRHLTSQLLFLAVVLGLQACGLESPDFDSTGSGQGGSGQVEQPSNNDNQGNTGGSGASTADLVAGKLQYDRMCSSCHGDTGQGSRKAKRS